MIFNANVNDVLTSNLFTVSKISNISDINYSINVSNNCLHAADHVGHNPIEILSRNRLKTGV